MNHSRNGRGLIAAGLALSVLAATPSHAGVIERAAFCATDEAFHFSVDVTSFNVDTFDLVVYVYVTGNFNDAVADRPNESVGTNIDRQTCEVTRRSPRVLQEFLQPGTDHLENGELAPDQYTLTSIGDGMCRFEGSIPHGADPLQPGDVVPEVWFREFEPYVDTRVNGTVITECADTEPPPEGIFKDGFEAGVLLR